jgi:AcrR family transcriptional regulator
MSAVATRRGRPATITADEIEHAALRLWDLHGYDRIPLGDVAAAVGVSARTVFRYFPSKSDIVWRGLDEAIQDLKANLQQAAGEPTLMARMRAAILASLCMGDDLSISRLRMRLISRTPELQNNYSPTFIAWRVTLEDYVADQLGIDADGLVPRIAASSIQNAAMAALAWWGAHGGDPHDVVDRALRGLEDGFGAA